MTQLRAERANSSNRSPDGLTPLHRAVLANDTNAVRKIVNERELGVDVRTAAGVTPLMIAAMFGRCSIFLYLLGKKASPDKKDSKGNGLLEYVKQKSPFVQTLVGEYKNTASVGPDRGGRRDIYVVLKAIKYQNKKSYAQGQAAARDESRTETQLQAPTQPQLQAPTQPQLQAPAQPYQTEKRQPLQDTPARFVFLRSSEGKEQEFAEIRQLAVAKHGDLRRHCTGFIRAAGDNSGSIFAISGWGIKNDNAARENVLADMEYTILVRQVAEALDFELGGNNSLDHSFPGTPSEQKGAYLACHAEKKLAVYVLMKALSHMLNTEVITANNIMLLKDQINKLPPGLRETTIHLDHKLVCSNCVKKTGLAFRCESNDWYIPGTRSQLQMGPDGQYQPVARATRHSDSHRSADVIDDELGLFVGSHDTGEEVTPSTPTIRGPYAARQVVPRVLSDPEKRGSPVFEPPQHHTPRYAAFDVTPPSRKAPVLPTPQSQSRFAEIPCITTSPSPVETSSAVPPGTQADSMSPSPSQEWEVEEIVQAKEEDGVQWYLVQWRGFSEDSCSWEREGNLTNAMDAIRKFWEDLRATQSQTQDMDVQKPEESNT